MQPSAKLPGNVQQPRFTVERHDVTVADHVPRFRQPRERCVQEPSRVVRARGGQLFEDRTALIQVAVIFQFVSRCRFKRLHHFLIELGAVGDRKQPWRPLGLALRIE
ncbi:hypothetical protein LP419_03885 [Massilia sp. H-1]|nr:hypothetical protein LP419_03885 [Massilia sp. H-1]